MREIKLLTFKLSLCKIVYLNIREVNNGINKRLGNKATI